MITRSAGASLAVAGVGALLMLSVSSPLPATFDEVGFCAALTRYDLLAFEPHFPGYPIAVAAARLAAALGAQAPYALAAATLLFLCAPLIHRAAGGGGGGVLSVALFAWAPLAIGEGARPMADSIATNLLAAALALSLVRPEKPRGAHSWALGLLIGLAIAAKPDFAFFLPLLLIPLRQASPRERWLMGCGLALPLLAACAALWEGSGGGARLWGEASRFVHGHLTEWGGGVATTRELATPRLGLISAPLAEALGGHRRWLLSGSLLAWLSLRAPRRMRRHVAVATLAYALWLLLGQNLSHPRHVLPLLPFLALLVGAGWRSLPAHPGLKRALLAGLLLTSVSGSILFVARSRARPRAGDQLCARVTQLDPLTSRVYAGLIARVVNSRLPSHDVRLVRGLADARRDLALDPWPPTHAFFAHEERGEVRLEPMEPSPSR